MEPGEYDTIAQLEDHHWWYLGMRAAAGAWLNQGVAPALRGTARPARLLDAGCGTGGGLRWLARYGVPVGLDFHPAAVAYAHRSVPRVARGSVMALPFAAGCFDLVTAFEVLYHAAVPDDVAALREFARVLRPGGWLLLRLPAHNWLRGAHDRRVHTRHRYARGELRAKLQRAGFRIYRLSYLGLSLVLPAVVRRLLQSRSSAHSDVGLPPPAVNRALLAVLQLEGRWLAGRDLPAGLSLMALARRAEA
jgi:SAM-dependent methyltransferase